MSLMSYEQKIFSSFKLKKAYFEMKYVAITCTDSLTSFTKQESFMDSYKTY